MLVRSPTRSAAIIPLVRARRKGRVGDAVSSTGLTDSSLLGRLIGDVVDRPFLGAASASISVVTAVLRVAFDGEVIHNRHGCSYHVGLVAGVELTSWLFVSKYSE